MKTNTTNLTSVPEPADNSSNTSSFIEANTKPVKLYEIENLHIIPVFIKDNEPLISHSEFIGSAIDIVHHVFEGETVLEPNIRVSHPVKGRIPEAKGKPADQLKEYEKTLYYERMAFVIEVPSINREINGNSMNLTIGGVKAYNLDNLNARKGSPEHFKVFIGFENKICTNLCVWTDGYSRTFQVDNLNDLEGKIYELMSGFTYSSQSNMLNRFGDYELSEHQFAQLIGRARMYHYLPTGEKEQLPDLHLNDSQIRTVAEEYYNSEHFSHSRNGRINLWDLYNLFTEANKSSYIDTFLDRSVNAYQFTSLIANALEEDSEFWFLN